jgi:hypothetical protein
MGGIAWRSFSSMILDGAGGRQTWKVLTSAMMMPVYEFHILFQRVYSELASGRYSPGSSSKEL